MLCSLHIECLTARLLNVLTPSTSTVHEDHGVRIPGQGKCSLRTIAVNTRVNDLMIKSDHFTLMNELISFFIPIDQIEINHAYTIPLPQIHVIY